MNYYPYDSKQQLYKKPFGAAEENTPVEFCVVLHRDALVSRVFLITRKDGEDEVYTEMPYFDELEDGFVRYRVELAFDEGLYFYFFAFDSDYGHKRILRSGPKGIITEQGSYWQLTVYEKDFKTPDLEGSVIYQIFPDRFYNSGEKKENVPADRFIQSDWNAQPLFKQDDKYYCLGNDYYGGDLKGIEKKLSYLEELGVNIIYLNPIFEAHSNHRYNTADYTKIDPMLGTEEDLISLCNAAKKKGIKIILDGVFSHTGADSVYFNKNERYNSLGAYQSKNSPYSSWYNFGRTRDDYSSWWGIKSLPEVNEDCESFTNFICSENGVLRKWLRDGISGWRLDVADELPDLFLENLRKAIKQENEKAIIIGEVWEDATNKISYSKRRKFLRGSQLDSVMNYVFADAVIDFVCTGGAAKFMETVESVIENYPPQTLHILMNHIGTHDTARVLTRLAGLPLHSDRYRMSDTYLNSDERERGLRLLKIAAAIQYTLPGIPSLYYGDEAGVEGYGDPFCRSAYPWGNEEKNLVEFYKRLGTWRRDCKALKKGRFIPRHAEAGHLSYERQDLDSRVLVAVNRFNSGALIYVPKEWQYARVIFGASPENGNLYLPPESVTILEI